MIVWLLGRPPSVYFTGYIYIYFFLNNSLLFSICFFVVAAFLKCGLFPSCFHNIRDNKRGRLFVLWCFGVLREVILRQCYLGGLQGHVEFRLSSCWSCVTPESVFTYLRHDACHANVPKLSRHNRTLVIKCDLTVKNIWLLLYCCFVLGR